MLKGLAITPPILGRIAIGKVVEKAGKRLPEKDDQFTITSQVQGKDGWVAHPFDEQFRQGQGGKIRSLPIRLLFNDPSLNFRAAYHLFDRTTGRPLCIGNGEQCKRQSEAGTKTLPCPTPACCPLAVGGACKPLGRLNVSIGDDDLLGSFIFRTAGFNSIRTLAARLLYFQAVSGNRLACLPLELKLRGKSTRQSFGTPIYYVDLTIRAGMTLENALAEAKQTEEKRLAAGFDQVALDAAARVGLANGAFEESEEESVEVVEEFFATSATDQRPATETGQVEEAGLPQENAQKVSLVKKLEAKTSKILVKTDNRPLQPSLDSDQRTA